MININVYILYIYFYQLLLLMIIQIEQWPYKALADSLEVIPRTLIQNCGGNAIKVLTQLRAKHAQGQHTWGIDGTKGVIVDMKEYGIWDPYAVKAQTIKTAIEVCFFFFIILIYYNFKFIYI